MKTHHLCYAAASFVALVACGQMFAAYPAMRSAVVIISTLAIAASVIFTALSVGNVVAGAEYVERKHFGLGALPGGVAIAIVVVALLCGVMIGG